MQLRRPRRPGHRFALRFASFVAVASVSVAIAPPASADATLGDTFEGGVSDVWSVLSNVSVTPAAARTGTYGARAVSTPLDPGYLSWNRVAITQGMRYARVSGWVRIGSCDCTDNVPILSIKNANGVNHFDLWRDAATGDFRYDLLSRDNAYSDIPAQVGRWYFVEALVDFSGGPDGSTFVGRVRIDGDAQTTIRSTDQEDSSVRSAWFGGPTLGATNTRDYDDIDLDVSDSPLYFTR
jgi:hypothetical protein